MTVLYIKKTEDLNAFIKNVKEKNPSWDFVKSEPHGDAFAVFFDDKKTPMPTKLEAPKEAPKEVEKEAPKEVEKEVETEEELETKFESLFSTHITTVTAPKFKAIKDRLTELEDIKSKINDISKKFSQLENANSEEHKKIMQEQDSYSSDLQKLRDTIELNLAKITDEHNKMLEWKNKLVSLLKEIPSFEMKFELPKR